jgi:hypothetical protein
MKEFDCVNSVERFEKASEEAATAFQILAIAIKRLSYLLEPPVIGDCKEIADKWIRYDMTKKKPNPRTIFTDSESNKTTYPFFAYQDSDTDCFAPKHKIKPWKPPSIPRMTTIECVCGATILQHDKKCDGCGAPV